MVSCRCIKELQWKFPFHGIAQNHRQYRQGGCTGSTHRSANLYNVCKLRATAGAGRAAGVPWPGALPVDVGAVAPKQRACRRHRSVAQDLHLSGEKPFAGPWHSKKGMCGII